MSYPTYGCKTQAMRIPVFMLSFVAKLCKDIIDGTINDRDVYGMRRQMIRGNLYVRLDDLQHRYFLVEKGEIPDQIRELVQKYYTRQGAPF